MLTSYLSNISYGKYTLLGFISNILCFQKSLVWDGVMGAGLPRANHSILIMLIGSSHNFTGDKMTTVLAYFMYFWVITRARFLLCYIEEFLCKMHEDYQVLYYNWSECHWILWQCGIIWDDYVVKKKKRDILFRVFSVTLQGLACRFL